MVVNGEAMHRQGGGGGHLQHVLSQGLTPQDAYPIPQRTVQI